MQSVAGGEQSLHARLSRFRFRIQFIFAHRRVLAEAIFGRAVAYVPVLRSEGRRRCRASSRRRDRAAILACRPGYSCGTGQEERRAVRRGVSVLRHSLGEARHGEAKNLHRAVS
jgi:hypothetical protein